MPNPTEAQIALVGDKNVSIFYKNNKSFPKTQTRNDIVFTEPTKEQLDREEFYDKAFQIGFASTVIIAFIILFVFIVTMLASYTKLASFWSIIVAIIVVIMTVTSLGLWLL